MKKLEMKNKGSIIKTVVIYIVTMLIVVEGAILTIDGSFIKKEYSRIWDQNYIESLDSDGEKILAGALTASSSHNMQPWLVKKIDDVTYELYADMSKDLSVIDSNHTQMLMSQGSFIEAFSQTATKYGYQTEVTLEDMDFSSDMPFIATLKLEKNFEVNDVDVVSSSSVNPKANKNGLADVTEEIEKALELYPTFTYQLIENENLAEFKSVLLTGTEIESRNQAATEELINVFRWTQRDKNKFRNGLTLNISSPIMQPIVQSFMKVFPSSWESFGEQGIDAFEKRLESERGYVLLKSTTDTPEDYVNIGRLYQSLSQNVGGYLIRPAVQVLETFDDMQSINQSFQAEYGDDSTVMLIIGLQELNLKINQNNPAPRHLVEDILIP